MRRSSSADRPSSATVPEVLRAAGIAPERWGRARLERLSPPERQLYEWILRRFAHAAVPSAEATRAAAHRFGLDPDQALATLAEEDLIHADNEGWLLVAYPFSAVARGHRVTITGTGTVEAMCALDALGMASMLARPIEVVSRDPLTGRTPSAICGVVPRSGAAGSRFPWRSRPAARSFRELLGD